MNKSDALLAGIRNGQPLAMREKLSLIWSLSIPSILAQVTSVMMFFIDAAMVGHLGAAASASIGLMESTTWLMGSITNAASMGFSVQVAHYIGANDFKRAREVFRNAIMGTAVVSFTIALVGLLVFRRLPVWLGGGSDIAPMASTYFIIYALTVPFFQLSGLCGSMLKCSGNMKIPSVVSVMVCVLDVLFNYFFIFVLGWGVTGAAVGTSLAIVCGAAVQGYYAMFRNRILNLRQDGGLFRWIPQYVRSALKIGSPMAMQSVFMNGAQIVSTMIVAPLGTIAIAANSFAITVESLCYMPGYGIGDAATTLVGQSRGAGRLDVCRSFAFMATFLGMAVMAVMGLVMYVFAPELMTLLTPVADIRDLGVMCLRIEAFAEPMFAASIVVYCVCVGAGDTMRPMLINLVSMWCVRLSLAAMLAPRYGLKGVWVAMAIELTFRGLMYLIRLVRGRWMQGGVLAGAKEVVEAQEAQPGSF